MRLSLLIIFVVFAGVGIFALQNQTTLQVKFLRYTWETSQSIVIMISLALGLAGGILAMVPGLIKRWRKIRSLEKEMTALKRGTERIPEDQES